MGNPIRSRSSRVLTPWLCLLVLGVPALQAKTVFPGTAWDTAERSGWPRAGLDQLLTYTRDQKKNTHRQRCPAKHPHETFPPISIFDLFFHTP